MAEAYLPYDPVHTSHYPPQHEFPTAPHHLQQQKMAPLVASSPLSGASSSAAYQMNPSLSPMAGASEYNSPPRQLPVAPIGVQKKRGRRSKSIPAPVLDNDANSGISDSAPTTMSSAANARNTAPRQCNIKTKFPVARIKRIMQADEDVGKVAQVTPVVVSKALELFMISLCDKASAQARQRNSKRITAGHLKQAILHEEQFDFLTEIVEKIADIPTAAENPHHSNGDSGEDGPPVKKQRKPRTRKVKDEDSF